VAPLPPNHWLPLEPKQSFLHVNIMGFHWKLNILGIKNQELSFQPKKINKKN
jgi:hypothetical protein